MEHMDVIGYFFVGIAVQLIIKAARKEQENPVLNAIAAAILAMGIVLIVSFTGGN